MYIIKRFWQKESQIKEYLFLFFFQGVFRREIEECLQCILQLRAAIDEFAVTGTQQDWQFKYSTYSKVFTQLMGMQAKIDANPKHAAMTRALRISWATAGRWVLSLTFYLISLIFYAVRRLMATIWRLPERKISMLCSISFFYSIHFVCDMMWNATHVSQSVQRNFESREWLYSILCMFLNPVQWSFELHEWLYSII